MQRRAYDKNYKKELNKERTKFQRNELSDWSSLNDIRGSFQERSKKINKKDFQKKE